MYANPAFEYGRGICYAVAEMRIGARAWRPSLAAPAGCAPAQAAGPPAAAPATAAAVRTSRSQRRAAASSGAGSSTASACPRTATGSTPTATRARASPSCERPTDAWHQLGNDHIVATAHTRGYVQLWSQDRTYQWVNLADPAAGQYAGGYGYLRTAGGRVISTLYADRPAGARTAPRLRHRLLRPADRGAAAWPSSERVYAPFGDDPVLLHDVTIRNTSRRPLRGELVRVLGRQPAAAWSTQRYIGLARPAYDRRLRTLSAGAAAGRASTRRPLTIFAAALRGRSPTGRPTRATFFGAAAARGRPRSRPGRLSRTLAARHPGGDGRAGTCSRSARRWSCAPGGPVTLRYAYGAAPTPGGPRARQALARRAATRSGAASAPGRPGCRGCASAPAATWLSRELQWDAYMLRSGATYEETCGHHILSQGGYYQYELGFQAAFRDPLQHILPLIYADPELARETIRYSAERAVERRSGSCPTRSPRCASPPTSARPPTSTCGCCSRPPSTGSRTRDLSFFDERLPWADGGSGVALGAPAPGPPQPGEPARPARRLPHRHDRRLVGLLDARSSR